MPEYYQAILTGLTTFGSFLLGLLVKKQTGVNLAVVFAGLAALLTFQGCAHLQVDRNCAVKAVTKCAVEMQKCFEDKDAQADN